MSPRLTVNANGPALIAKYFPLLAIAVVLFSLQAAHHAWPVLAYDRGAIENGEWWRLITGHLVHNNVNHLLLNTAGWIVACCLLGSSSILRPLVIILSLSVITSLFIYALTPTLTYYVGFSAVLHGLIFLAGIRRIRRRLFTGYLICATLLVKAGWQLLYPASTAETAATIGLPVAVEAHAFGLIAAILLSPFRSGTE